MSLSITLSPRSGFPVYLQIVQQVERAIAIGLLCPGERLPTIKQLATDLIINPSTVAKALRELEHLNIVTTVPGHGTYVSENGRALALQQTAESTVAEAVERVVNEARSLAIEGPVLQTLFDRAYARAYATDDRGETR